MSTPQKLWKISLIIATFESESHRRKGVNPRQTILKCTSLLFTMTPLHHLKSYKGITTRDPRGTEGEEFCEGTLCLVTFLPSRFRRGGKVRIVGWGVCVTSGQYSFYQGLSYSNPYLSSSLPLGRGSRFRATRLSKGLPRNHGWSTSAGVTPS